MLEEAIKRKEQIIADYEYLHANAESGFGLTATRAYVKKRLSEMGYSPKDCGRAGIVAEAGLQENGKTILLRADMDALPMKEEAEVPYACNNGNMHACGHDAHTAMLLGAAGLLKYHETELKGRVKLMFQPAEELLEGAKDMLASGVLENPTVDAAFMIHVLTGVPYRCGSVVVSAPGVSAPAADFFAIEIKGEGCHGSMPEKGVDPLTVAAHMMIALQEIHARELGIQEDAVLTIGAVEGANVGNVIPDKVILKGSMRCYRESTRNKLKKRLAEIAEGIATTFRAQAVVTYSSGCPELENDKDMSTGCTRWLQKLLGEEMVYDSRVLGTGGGSEDFAYVAKEVPSLMVALAAGDCREGYEYPLHHPKMRLDEKAFAFGAAVYATVAMEYTGLP